ncbi:hypothetical protein CRN84_01895 [Budvicia aquatica]|uniref:Uncharacterized protein n=1 Tax=Budvicia aquatica TaxID=82979 RepID=A0A2C6DH87_9GAMM|nr:hypothetical protein CRN84_01895 [Budvicia aquatica]
MISFTLFDLYPSSFKLHFCWLCSLARITYLSKLIGTRSLAAVMQFEIFWVKVFRELNSVISNI